MMDKIYSINIDNMGIDEKSNWTRRQGQDQL